jgi:Spx/MgsR family transcriptional regulator
VIKVHGIVNCDTVKKARAWLDERGVGYAFVDFRKTPPSRALLARWCDAQGWETLVNRRGTTWRKLDAADQARVVDAASAIDVLLAHPSAIKRPVVETGDAVVVGFDPVDWERRFPSRR